MDSSVAIPNADSIRGTVESCSRQTYENSKKEEIISQHFGLLLMTSKWLPAADGSYKKPCDITLEELPQSFKRDKKLAEQLKMKDTETEQALDTITGGDIQTKDRIKRFLDATPEMQEKLLALLPREQPPQPAPSFQKGIANLARPQRGNLPASNTTTSYPVSNPESYQERADEEVSKGVREHETTPRTITFSPVKINPSNKEARTFLYQQYYGKCQITGNTFPKASRSKDGKSHNYFMACSLLSYADAHYLNDPGNMLCVSADTLAKLKHASFEFIDNIEKVIMNFKEEGSRKETVSLRIKLAGEECTITWTQRHFMRLIALYDSTQ